MIAIVVAVLTAVASLSLPNGSPYSRFWRPSFLFSASSALGLFFTYSYFGFEQLDPAVPMLYAAGTISFFVGDALCSARAKASAVAPREGFGLGEILRDPALATIYYGLSAVGMVLLIFLYIQRSSLFNMFDLGSALRYAESIARLPTFGAYHFLLFGQAIGSVFILNEKRLVRILGYACYAALVFGSFVAVSRTMVFSFMGSFAFLLYVRSGSLKPLAVPAAVLVVLSIFYAAFANKEMINDRSSFIYYAGYAIYAFSDFVWSRPVLEYGVNSFGVIGWILRGGLRPEDLRLVEGEYNVYTFMGAPYRDFGVLGVILIPFVFGMIWSMVWNRTGNRPIYLFMYSWLVFPCVIPFFDWKFGSTIYLYLPVIYFALLQPQFKARLPNPRPVPV